MTRGAASGRVPRTARSPTRRSLPVATAPPAPAGPWSRSAGPPLARGLGVRPVRLGAPPLRWLPERPAAGLLEATGRPPPPPAPPHPPGWRPERRPRTGGNTTAWVPPPRLSPPCCAPQYINEPTCPASVALIEEPPANRAHSSKHTS